MRLEVRCCCQPQKLLGWLIVPDHVRDGSVVSFVVSPAHWVRETLDSAPSFQPADRIDLPVATFGTYTQDGAPVRRRALKSEEIPIARLRRIPGFIEADPD